QERARFGRLPGAKVRNIVVDVMPPHRAVRSGRVEGGDGSARTPALAPEPHAFEEIDRLPVHIRLAQAEPGDRPRVESGPWREWVAAAESPYLDARCRFRAGAARMKTECVGDDERVRRRRNQLRLRQSKLAQLVARYSAHELCFRLTGALARADAHAPFPFEPLRRQPVRA